MDKKIMKFGETEIEKHKFHQDENRILIYNIDINKILEFALLTKFLMVKWVLNISLVTKMVKMLGRYR